MRRDEAKSWLVLSPALPSSTWPGGGIREDGLGGPAVEGYKNWFQGSISNHPIMPRAPQVAQSKHVNPPPLRV